jgi:putative multiple sugar transport system substrate-binding protein
MFKKFFFGLMVVVLITGMIAACTPAATEAPPAPVAATAVPVTSAATVRPAIPTAAEIPATPTATLAPTATQTLVVSAGGKIPVGIVLPNSSVSRWLQDQASFRTSLKALGYTAQILFSQDNLAREKSNVESLIKQGIKVLILSPVDASGSAAVAEEARAAGVKVIAYDRLILNTTAVDYYVSFDNVSVGQAQGRYLVEHAKGKGEPLYLYAGSPGDNNAFMFFEGAWSVLQPKIADGTFVIKNSSQAVALQDTTVLTRDEETSILGQITTNWSSETARKLAKSNLASVSTADKGDVAILAPNDNSARTIADVFAADKDVTTYVITGQDADRASVQYIINGRQSMTVYKDTRMLAGDAILAALAFLTDQVPVKTTVINNGVIDVPTNPSMVVVVEKSNIKSALIDTGQFKASDFSGLK